MHTQPNVMIILCDQLRPFELGCYGHALVETPNIDRLATNGVRFETACTPNPVCTPARASLISGQYGRSCQGMLGNVSEPSKIRYQFPDTTLPERLSQGYIDEQGKSNSYHTTLTGKWHIGPHPSLLGFQQAVYPKVHHLNCNQRYYNTNGQTWIQEGYVPPFEVATSCEFMLQNKQDRPFFLYHNISLPHMPYFDVPLRFREKYRPQDMLLRPNVWRDEQMYFEETPFLIYLYDYLYYKEQRLDCQQIPPGYDLRHLYADYCGLITAVDEQVGQLMDGLEKSGQADNTIVIFTADHGDNLGSHHRWNKNSLNDEAIRIPFIVSWPAQLTPTVVETQIASLIDIAPTILGLTGRPIPVHMQGRNLSPILHGDAKHIGNGEAFIENLHGELGIRTLTHLFAVMTELHDGSPKRIITDDDFMFYDMREDPYQMTNLAKTGAQAEIAADLRERLLAWDAATQWMPGSLGGWYGQGPLPAS